MLVSGILVAVGGIIVFTLSLEDMSHFINKGTNEIDWKSYLIRSMRPSLILIFIEFIAIFLLKQYRALMLICFPVKTQFFRIYRFSNLSLHRRISFYR